MNLIRCTRKLLNELDLNTSELSGVISVDQILGEWYCNLLHFDRRKSLLFTSADTLYSFVVPGIQKKDLVMFDVLFSSNLKENLKYEKFSSAEIEKVLPTGGIRFGKTASRSVLGSMHDYAIQSEYFITFGGGLKKLDILDMNRKLNQSPMSAIGMKRGIDLLTEILRQQV